MILASYLRREVLKPFLLVSLVLSVSFACYMAARYLAQAGEGEIPVAAVWHLVVLRLCIAQEVLLPSTFYFSVLLSLGRLYRDAEMVAMFACGFPKSGPYRALLPLALGVAAVVGFLSLELRPRVWGAFYALKRQAQTSFALSRLRGGVFYELPGGHLFYAEAIGPEGEARGVFIYEARDDLRRIVRARRARQTVAGDRPALLLLEGRDYEWRKEGDPVLVSEFEDLVLPLPRPSPSAVNRVKTRPTAALWRAGDRESLAELGWRLSAPLSVLTLGLLALVLSPVRPRESRFKRLPLAVAAFGLFFYGSASLKRAVIQGAVAPWPGVCWSHLGLLALCLILGLRGRNG